MAMIPRYGLDIETDTTVNGLDPRVAPVVAAALSGADDEIVFDGPEPELLAALDAAIAALPPGVLVTWNGASFDLPFLATRAVVCAVPLGLRLELDLAIPGRHDPLPGHPGSFRGRWYQHDHLDGYQVYRADVGASLGLPCGLKPLARLAGLDVIEVDRAAIHRLPRAERQAYVASDARLARQLVDRRPTALAASDQLPSGS